MDPVKDLSMEENEVDALVRNMSYCGGFTARKLARGVDILEKMQAEGCVKFLSFPACITATGTRGIIRDLVKEKLFDVVVTTAGTLDHDLARLWKDYYHGSFSMDDRDLHGRGINRLGNVLIPNESYGIILEEKIQPMLLDIYSKRKEVSGYELVWEIGRMLGDVERREESIIYWSWKNQIPVFIPGMFDGSVGFQLWLFWQTHRDFKINLFLDEQRLADIVFGADKTGALMVGGGISKHHTIWWNQFNEGLDYSVYVTTASEYDGSLSGARMSEAISWGKLKEDAKFVTVDGDATLILPFMASALWKRLSGE